MMRIITGKARGVRLETLEGDMTRPTSERAKEAVFSMLQNELDGINVLDLFSGSGQLGLEAVSRGASHALLCDASPAAVAVIEKNAIKTKLALQCDVLKTDFRDLRRHVKGTNQFNLVFLDPPYAAGLMREAINLLVDRGYLAPAAKVVCESASWDDVPAREDFEILRQTHYGVAYVTVLEWKGEIGK